MSVTPQEMERLVFIKQLYLLGVEQSRSTTMTAANSILMYHDSVELFLYLLWLKYVNTAASTTNSPPFVSYWNELSGKLPSGEDLPLKPQMIRLNNSRVLLKHQGFFPSATDIAELTRYVRDFFDEVTLSAFAIEFNSISQVMLIKDSVTKSSLEEAQSLFNSGRMEDAIGKVATGFYSSIIDYRTRRGSIASRGEKYNQPTIYYGKPQLNFLSRDELAIIQIHELGEKLLTAVTNIRETLDIITTGIDYQKYDKFMRVIPLVYGSPPNITVLHLPGDKIPTPEQYEYCFDFAVGTAMYLQSLDPINI